MNKSMKLFVLVIAIVYQSTLVSQSDTEQLISSQDLDNYCKEIETSITRDCDFAVQQITQFNIPFTITTPGLYCFAPNIGINPNLTGRLVVSSGRGIIVNSSNVILDFNDTILEGNGGTVGVTVNSGIQNVIIRNGTVQFMTNSGIILNNNTNQSNGPIIVDNMTFVNNPTGLNTFSSLNLLVRNSKAFFSTISGFSIFQGINCVFDSCVSDNNVNGFAITSSNALQFSKCQASSNTANGFNISGIAASQFIACTANRNQTGFIVTNGTVPNQSNLFDGCFAAQNSNNGFFITSNQITLQNSSAFNNATGFFINGNNNSLLNSIAKNNTLVGINATVNDSQVDNCQSINNNSHGIQINGNNNSLFNSIAKNNTGNGIQIAGISSELQNCHALDNGLNGIIINGNNHSLLNSIAKQNNNGILLAATNAFGVLATNCQVRENTVTANTTGLNNQGTDNRIYTNFANNNGTNFVNVPNVAVSPTEVTPINFTANVEE